MASRFSGILIVDWSASDTASPARPSPDAIHAALRTRRGLERRYFRTRAACMDWVRAQALEAASGGGRLLAGFDFAFGYPAGAAQALGGAPRVFALWDRIAAEIADGADNRSNRFAAAARMNADLPEGALFWGHPPTHAYAGLTMTKPRPYPAHPAETRLAERRARLAPGRNGQAQPVWKLSGAGAVGGQALLGINALARLRGDPALAGAIAVWPFDGGFRDPGAPVVLAEIFPSLWAEEIAAAAQPGEIKDAAQVRFVAERFCALDAAGAFPELFSRPSGLTDAEAEAAVREEGWILGLR